MSELHHTGDAAPERPSLHGLAVTSADRAALLNALEQAFDYRGDCTITTTDGNAVTGYIFDRRRGASLEDSFVRLLAPDSPTPHKIAFAAIERLEFTGKDAAHGRGFDRWVKKFIEMKLAGQRASIESEPLN